MPRHILDNRLLDRLEVRPNTEPHHLLTVLAWAGDETPEGASWADAGDLPGAGALFRFSSWTMVPGFFECAARRRDWNFNADGFRFAENRDLGDTEFGEVLLVDYFDQAEVSYLAFDVLCTRAFEALRAFAAARAPEVMQEPWWPRFLADGEEVATRERI